MRITVADPGMAAALAGLGGGEGDVADGVVFAPAPAATWSEAEDELATAYRLAREASLTGASVFFVVDAAAALGRATPLDSAVAVGLVAGGRCLAFEGQRKGQFATVIAHDADQPLQRIAEVIEFASGSGVGLGQTIMTGATHLGALLP
ncbi:hypothetical protein [Nocardioides sp. AE5]|uniref:hypothetical protein n=1 Tax=Nocardioides sp. AE5 TaxID=2962573 RepID=UPI00288276F2|nr:hypothetical protein [Nocardioides sp. AE5]MDT0203050.1 hypothetical protein [Nocardioides sp. AE5]